MDGSLFLAVALVLFPLILFTVVQRVADWVQYKRGNMELADRIVRTTVGGFIIGLYLLLVIYFVQGVM